MQTLASARNDRALLCGLFEKCKLLKRVKFCRQTSKLKQKNIFRRLFFFTTNLLLFLVSNQNWMSENIMRLGKMCGSFRVAKKKL